MRRRDFILTGVGLLGWLVLPPVATAEEPKPERDPRWNGTYDNLGREPRDADGGECRHGDAGETPTGNFYWVSSSGVDWRSQRINRFRSRHSAALWRARAFPASVRRVHGFPERRGHRGHGRGW